jgi:DNA-binding CsgD family transcriptional regulator
MISEADKEKIVAMAKRGKSPVEIAKELHLSPQSVAGFMSLARKQGLLPSEAFDPTRN